MSSLSLDGEWELFYFAAGEHRIEDPSELDSLELESISAQVPGNVELDMVRAGRLPDPFYGANIRLLRPLENLEWWYRRRVMVPEDFPAQPCELIFEGLDTFATVWVNGVQVGQSANMLVEQCFDVSAAVQRGRENTFVVRLAPAML
jgi:beta-mannosidase